MLRPCGGYKSFAALGARRLFVGAISSPACSVEHEILPVPFPSLVTVLAGLDYVFHLTLAIPALVSRLVEPPLEKPGSTQTSRISEPQCRHCFSPSLGWLGGLGWLVGCTCTTHPAPGVGEDKKIVLDRVRQMPESPTLCAGVSISAIIFWASVPEPKRRDMSYQEIRYETGER